MTKVLATASFCCPDHGGCCTSSPRCSVVTSGALYRSHRAKNWHVRFGLSPRAKSFASLQVLLLWPCCCDGASAALAGNAGRSESWSVAGQALAHGYRADPDRQAAHRWPACCLRPQRGPSRSAPWQAKGSPGSRPPFIPQVLNGGSRQVRAGPRRPLWQSVPSWVILALGSCAPFSPPADRWRAAVHALKNEPRAFWSRGG